MLRDEHDSKNHGGIKCVLHPNPGLVLTWGRNFFGSMKRADDITDGELSMEKRAVPLFLYGMASQMTSMPALDPRTLNNILRSGDASERLRELSEAYTRDAKERWERKCTFLERPYSALERRDPSDRGEMESIMGDLWSHKIAPGMLTPVAFVPDALKGGVSVTLLKPKTKLKDDFIYIAQSRGPGDVNIVKAGQYVMGMLARDIVEKCGLEAAVALKPFLRDSSANNSKRRSFA